MARTRDSGRRTGPGKPRRPAAAAPGFAARRAALRMLDAVLNRGETLEHSEKAALRELASTPDKQLAKALASEALRWLTDLDRLIDGAMARPLPEDAKARSVLRLMLAGWLRLDTPPHAVIATGLPLLSGGPRRLAHGVFSALVKQEAKLPDCPSLPAHVAERWDVHQGWPIDAIGCALAAPPPLDLTLRDERETEAMLQQIQAQENLASAISFAPGHIRVPRGVAVSDIPGFAKGDWWVQDFAASLPARLLGPGEGRRALDLCAAPGGKTMQLASLGWDVTALDISKRRMQRLTSNLERTGLKARLMTANALDWEPEQAYDAILLDAPCSATGTCRRHPDVLYRIGAREIGELTELQSKLIDRAASWLKPGGVMIYAVCSLEWDEGEAHPCPEGLSPHPISSAELPQMLASQVSLRDDGALRTRPDMLADKGGMDGFFITRWQQPRDA